jgi:hypothetical protein
MKWLMENRRCFSLAVITAFVVSLLLSLALAQKTTAATMSMVADKHKAMGLECAACHKESPPKDPVPASVCMGCHGDAAAMAQKTAKKSPNPHAAPELNCTMCHKAHK